MALSRNQKRHKKLAQRRRQAAEQVTRSKLPFFTAQRPFVPMDPMTLRGRRQEIVHFPDGTVRTTNVTIWHNSIYAVAVYEPATKNGPTQITVQRFDEQPARDWRHLQQIKNDVFGPEYEAVELFPAQSRVLDFTNTTHLWAFKERFNLG